MSAFQFPDPASQQTVTNPSTGSTYNWVADPGKWVLVSSNFSQEFPEQVTYQIQTDKILRSSDPAIELVDSAGYYSNVKFTGTGGIGVTSDINGILIDASSINNTTRYNKGRVYAEELRNATMPRNYNIVNRTGVPTIRPGEISIDTKKAGEVKLISFGETSSEGLAIGTVSVGDKLCMTKIDSGRKYFYSIISGTTNSGIYGVDFIEADSWYATSDLTQTPHYLEIFPRAAFGRDVELENYYNKSEIDAKFAAGILPGDVDASDYWTKNEVSTAIEAVRATLQGSINATNDLIVPPGQNNPETYYGDYAPTGSLLNGDLWFDAMNLRLNVFSQGAWINPDRNDGADAEDRLSALEVRIAQLESN